jgi:V8-like Glu-specific endopeptidase
MTVVFGQKPVMAWGAAALIFAQLAAAPSKAGYDGVDNREDVERVSDTRIRANSRHVAGVITIPTSVNRSDRTYVTLKEYRLGERLSKGSNGYYFGFCPSERFLDQAYHPDCTGFLVAPDVLVTAGHCVAEETRHDLLVVFELKTDAAGRPYDRRIPRSRTYIAKEVILSKSYGDNYRVGNVEGETNGRDWAYIRLDEPVCDRAVLPRATASNVSVGQSIYMIGHPMGLPLKYAPGTVTAITDQAFLASIAGYTGNSGSPVFNATSHVVEGMYIGGKGDLNWDSGGQCWTTRCQECGAEASLRITQLPDPQVLFRGRLQACPAAVPGSKGDQARQDAK